MFTTHSPQYQQPVFVHVTTLDTGAIALTIYSDESLTDQYESISTFLFGPDGYTSKRVDVNDMATTIEEVWKMVDGYAESCSCETQPPSSSSTYKPPSSVPISKRPLAAAGGALDDLKAGKVVGRLVLMPN
jgi:hypothetical protein